jgi:prolyl 4-hydroxylase
MIQVASTSFARSKVIAGTHGEESPNSVRTSSGMFMISEHDRNLPANKVLREVAAAMGGIPEDDWVEATQVLQYAPGQRYLAHPDFYDENDFANLNRGGQRIYTMLTWLNEVKDGGATTFPNAKLKVSPHTFGSVLFYDVMPDGHPDTMSYHSGEPPSEGSTKYVAVNWCHGMPFW